MTLEVEVLNEAGLIEALIGLSYNKKTDKKVDEMLDVALRLSGIGQGHDKFLRFIQVWMSVRAPLYWWKQMDQYSFVVSQSESTMFTILKHPLNNDDFSYPLSHEMLCHLNKLRLEKNFSQLINDLPSGYMQRRMLTTNYGQLDTIIKQRGRHKLPEWQQFINQTVEQLRSTMLLDKTIKESMRDGR